MIAVTKGWVVRIRLGPKGASRNSTITLNYKNATVQRHITTDDTLARIEVFSGPSNIVGDLPQFPIKEQAKKTIKVTRAASGSGMVTFEFDDKTVVASGATTKSNTGVSIPAGAVKDDLLEVTLAYTPEGEMGTGAFETRLPAGWDAVEVVVSGVDESSWSCRYKDGQSRFS